MGDTKNNPMYSVFLLIIIATICFILVLDKNIENRKLSEISTKNKFVISNADNTDISDARSYSSSSSNDILFTLIRTGYPSLTFFDEDASDIVTYKILEGYNAVIEPSVSMEFSYRRDDIHYANSSKYKIDFEACSMTFIQLCYKGSISVEANETIVVPCNPFTDYAITCTERAITDTSIISRTGTGIAKCMYVRREIRDLTIDDLTRTLDDMYILWSVSEEEGQSLYGTVYHDASYFAAMHNFNAAQQNSDHLHEGLGFLPQHIKLTNYFENAVQAVDKGFSLPYWDYTIDVAENLTVFDSFIFTSDVFGSIKPPLDAYWGFTYKNETITTLNNINDNQNGTT